MSITKLNHSGQTPQLQEAAYTPLTTLDDLPDECLVHIFGYLNMRDLGALASTTKKISQISKDDDLWESIFKYPRFVFKHWSYPYGESKDLTNLSVFERKTEADRMLKSEGSDININFNNHRWRVLFSRALGIEMVSDSSSFSSIPSNLNDKQPMDVIKLLLKVNHDYSLNDLHQMLYNGISSLSFNDNFDFQSAKLLIELIEGFKDHRTYVNSFANPHMLRCALDHRCSSQMIELLINAGYVPGIDGLDQLVDHANSLNLPRETIELLENAKNRIPIATPEVAAPTKKNKRFCIMQ